MKRSLVFPILFLCVFHLGRVCDLSLLFIGTLNSDRYIFPFLLCLLLFWRKLLSHDGLFETLGQSLSDCCLSGIKITEGIFWLLFILVWAFTFTNIGNRALWISLFFNECFWDEEVSSFISYYKSCATQKIIATASEWIVPLFLDTHKWFQSQQRSVLGKKTFSRGEFRFVICCLIFSSSYYRVCSPQTENFLRKGFLRDAHGIWTLVRKMHSSSKRWFEWKCLRKKGV